MTEFYLMPTKILLRCKVVGHPGGDVETVKLQQDNVSHMYDFHKSTLSKRELR